MQSIDPLNVALFYDRKLWKSQNFNVETITYETKKTTRFVNTKRPMDKLQFANECTSEDESHAMHQFENF